MTPQARAEQAAQAMWTHDRASPALGMTLDHVAPGAATMSLTVAPTMLNGVGTCHGGIIFSLADSAFAFACNTHGPVSVAAQCSIAFLQPAREGDRLAAAATLRHNEGRNGIYDVQVTATRLNHPPLVIAEFRGHSRTTAATWLPHAN